MGVPGTAPGAGLADGGSKRSPGVGGGEGLALLAILALAAGLRLYRIDALPPGLWFDEAANGIDALHVLQGERPVFFPGNFGREPLYIYAVAASFWLLGASPTSLRLVSVGFGLLTVLATCALARELFGRRVALLAAAVAAFAFWPLALSRLGLRAVALPPVETLAAWLLWRGVWRGQLRWYALAGLAGGLSLYTYLAARAVPLWLGAGALGLALPGWRPGLTLRRHAGGVVLLAAVAALTLAPLARYFAAHPGQLLARVEAAGWAGGAPPGEQPREGVATSALRTLGVFVWRGDENPRHNLPGRPAFDPYLGLAFLVGLGLTIARAGRPEHALLLLWLAVMLLPGALAGEAPHFLRLAGALPPAVVLAALGLDAGWRWLARLRWPAVRRAGRAGLAAGLVASAGLTAADYFVAWAGRADVAASFSEDVVEAGRLGASLARQGTVVLSTHQYRGLPAPLALYPAPAEPLRTFPGDESLLLPGEAGGDLYYVYPRSVSRWDDRHCALLPCATPASVLRGPDGSETVVVYRVPAGAPLRVEPARGLAARFGESIGANLEVLGYDLDRRVAPGQWVRFTLYVRHLAPLAAPGDWQLFAHLVAPGSPGNLASAYADVSYRSLRPGDRSVVWLDLRAPASLSPGLYQIHFGVFNARDLRSLRATDAAGRDVGGLLIVGPVRVAGPAGPAPAPPRRAEASFGEPAGAAGAGPERLDLLGYAVEPAGGALSATLYWRAAEPPRADYTVFVHVVDAAGRLVAQHDGQPAGGRLPTGTWGPGEVVVDRHEVLVPAELRGQRLRVLVGLYQLETGQRLAASDPAGRPLGDALPLTEVEVR